MAVMRSSLESRHLRFVPCMLVVIGCAMMRLRFASNFYRDPSSERTVKAAIAATAAIAAAVLFFSRI
jgi:hypothetical protein